MEKLVFLSKFYLDKEKDIIVNCFKVKEEEIKFCIETPNHHTGNLITNLAKVCNVETVKNENDMKVIEGRIFAVINDDNEEVYILRLGGIKIANIYPDGRVERKAKIPAIIKILMAQTKDYRLPIEKTIVKSYVLKKAKFKTDLHTHINAILQPDILIALGIKHQIKYPLYFIRKLGIKLSDKQEEEIENFRKKVEKQFENSEMKGKKLERKIKDETYINFADLILNNLENASENIIKIRNSLVLMKDGQAVFTNLEKVYVYRYVFAKGKSVENKIKISQKNIEKIEDRDIRETLLKMQQDSEKGSKYEHNTIFQDKLLWIAREYQKQGITYTEISNSDFAKKGERGINLLEEINEVLPVIEEETGVSIRFLVAISRTLLTQKQRNESVSILKAVSKSPYIVGSDIIGEEINDITNFDNIIKQIVEYSVYEDPGFTIQIHAGENDAYKDNIEKAIDCVRKAVPQGMKAPKVRIGHGLYVPDLDSEHGKEIIKKIKEIDAILEFQITSNVRLNNLIELKNHPIKSYLKNDVKCVQGTDGCGFYGIDTIDEQISLRNLLDLTDEDFIKMRAVEDEIINDSKKYFIEKSKKFDEFLAGRDLRTVMIEEEEKNLEEVEDIFHNEQEVVEAEQVFKNKISELPTDKIPVIIAGGSFNSQNRETVLNEEYKNMLKELMQKINNKNAYFVIGHKMQGYEKAVIDISKELNKKFEVDAIVPKVISKEQSERILNQDLDKICVSIEPEELGIYKSFNYEIFERRKSIVVAFDGNSPVLNLVQEAKNGKADAKIYVNSEVESLSSKAKSLNGYVVSFKNDSSIIDKILEENPEIQM